ncbi:hypothetical protein H6G17_04965 [Chroococcidiopsis sp. FACHB-1243]|uniref:hypothetical protein n=1 Tax=Chroococcidiopsis sp. [FACHB-1243] TaxID=2692781 RepID=UPI00177AC708|nr:hypothetical protein [Chroococcidiopsis sp. [FACHB-1243]]MBD2304863.1 hypothetical protein [Chroococcidiopsis sp. [FACHB-1243]]
MDSLVCGIWLLLHESWSHAARTNASKINLDRAGLYRSHGCGFYLVLPVLETEMKVGEHRFTLTG